MKELFQAVRSMNMSNLPVCKTGKDCTNLGKKDVRVWQNEVPIREVYM